MRALAAVLALAGAVGAQPSQVATLNGPAKPAGTVLAKTGRLAGVVSEGGKLMLWSLPDVRILRTIELGPGPFDIFALSEDGVWFAAGDHTGDYTVWNTSTGARQMHFHLPGYYPFAITFSPDGKRLAIAPAGEPVQVYEVSSGKKLFELQRPVGGTAAVVFSRDGARIGTADTDTVVRIYDARNGELLARNADFLLVPLSAAFTADGKQLLAGGGDKIVATVDVATGSAVRKSPKAVDPVAYLEVSRDGALLAAALMHADNMLMPAPVLISETASGRKVQEWLPPGMVMGGSWTADGQLLVATATGNAVHLWRVR